MANKKPRDGISIRTMVIGLMLVIAWLSWAIAASSCLGPVVEPMAPRGPRDRLAGLHFIYAGFATFLVNSIRIDQAPAVFMNSLRHHPWHFWMFFILEGAAAGFGVWVKRVERELNPPRKRGKRRKQQP